MIFADAVGLLVQGSDEDGASVGGFVQRIAETSRGIEALAHRLPGVGRSEAEQTALLARLDADNARLHAELQAATAEAGLSPLLLLPSLSVFQPSHFSHCEAAVRDAVHALVVRLSDDRLAALRAPPTAE